MARRRGFRKLVKRSFSIHSVALDRVGSPQSMMLMGFTVVGRAAAADT